jgi:hypothetical protein
MRVEVVYDHLLKSARARADKEIPESALQKRITKAAFGSEETKT